MGKRLSQIIAIVILVLATVAFPLHVVNAEEEIDEAVVVPVVVEDSALDPEEPDDSFSAEESEPIEANADPVSVDETVEVPEVVEDSTEEEPAPAAESEAEAEQGESDEITDEFLAYLAANDLANSERYANGVPIARSEMPSGGLRLRAKANTPAAWSYTENGWVNSNGQVIPGAIAKGIDVSEWNGEIDWERVKADGISFAILRVGYSTYEDASFEYNASECERLGIPYGVYVYSYARTADQAAKEAEAVIRYLAGHTLDYPVYTDIEDTNAQGSLKPADFAAMATAFCTRIEQAGYEPGVYSMLSWWETNFTSSVFDSWSKWIAQIYSECQYEGSFRIWQCCWTGRVAGISTDVDLNFEFGDAPVAGLPMNAAEGNYSHPIAAGEYNIISGLSASKVVDTYNNSTSAGANIQLWTFTNGGGDRFRLSVDSQGLYTIRNVNSGKYVSLYRHLSSYGQNVVQMDDGSSLASKWIIEQDGSSYIIRSAYNTDYVLDVSGASSKDGANIGIYTENGGRNQRWTFRPLDYAARQTVPDGTYFICCSALEDIVLDIEGQSTKTSANVEFWTNNNGKNQKFNVSYAGGGYYTITGVGSGLVLDVSGNSKRTGANIIQYTSGAGKDNQLWAIVANDDGSYTIVSKLAGLPITAASGAAKGSNAELGPMDYSSNQRFTFVDASPAGNPNRPIADGTYVIESSLAPGIVLDVTGYSKKAGANVEIWNDNGGKNQQWTITWDSTVDAYAITSVNSGLFLDASGAKATNGANLIQYTGNSGKNQRWTIVADGDGYRICSLMDPSFVVDIEGYSSKPGANVELYKANGGANQRFTFNEVSGSSNSTPTITTGRVIENGTYEIAVASASTLVLDVAGESKEDRANVCLWTDHDSSNQRFRITWDNASEAYMITNINSGCVLDLAGSEAVVGANIQQYHAVGWLDQRWIITKTATGYKIASAVNPTYYLCLNSSTPAKGSNVQLGSSSSATVFQIRAV